MKKFVAFIFALIIIFQFPLQTSAEDSTTFPTYKDSSGNIIMENDYLKVSIDRWVRMTITDKRTGEIWDTDGFNESPMTYENNKVTITGMTYGTSVFDGQIELLPDKPEIECTVLSAKSFEDGCAFPSHVNVDKTTEVLLACGEGILIPATTTDLTIGYDCWGYGTGSLPLYGLIRGDSSYLQIVNTTADAFFDGGTNQTRDGLFNASLRWKSQKHQLGYQRKTTLVFFDSNSIVPMAKRFRDDMEKLGYVKTLEEKKQEIPNIDKFVGAISVWLDYKWDITQLNKFIADFKKNDINSYVYNECGFDSRATPIFEKLNKAGLLAARNPNNLTLVCDKKTYGVDYYNYGPLSDAWPTDLVKDENGKPVIGEYVSVDKLTNVPLGILCPSQLEKWSKITDNYNSKLDNASILFYDGLGAQPALECYDPNHPETRTESVAYKVNWISYYHKIGKIVQGEGVTYDMIPFVDSTEHNASYGFCHRSETNLGAGEATGNWTYFYDPSELVLKYGQGQKYRIPFWELVFHDCIVTMPWWGDTSCTYPDYWYKRDLFAILYGNSMNYSLTYNFFQQYLPEFVASYNRITNVARAVGYSEMTNFVYLTDDRNVQMTEFSNGSKIIVNFGDTVYTHTDGSVIRANSYKTIGIGTTDLTYTHITPNSSKVTINGKTISFDAYTINGNNYFKLRDIAYSFNSTGSPFNVTWDGVNNAIKIITDTKYAAAGGEMTKPSGLSPRMGYQTNSVIYINGQKVELTAYCINGNNYVKLRDLGLALGFGVNWNGTTSTIEITT